MKIRNGFVSNSSTSSFTCDICEETVDGQDIGLSEANMVRCTEGHTMCDSHEIDGKTTLDLANETEDGRYSFPVTQCPFCQMQDITQLDLLKYLLLIYSITKTLAVKKAKETYGTFERFYKAINSVKTRD